MIDVTGIVMAADPRRPWLAARSARSLRRAGVADVTIVAAENGAATSTSTSTATATAAAMTTAVASAAGRPILALRAGAWLRSPATFAAPPPAPAGRTVIAIGLPLSGRRAGAWRDLAGRTGGDFPAAAALPPADAVWLSPADQATADQATAGDATDGPAGRVALLRSLFDGAAPPPTVAAVARRVVRWPALDVWSDEPAEDLPGDVPDDDGPPVDVTAACEAPRLRVLQVVTSLQQGGAERVTWDLHQALPALGVAGGLVALGRPLRQSLPAVADAVDLAELSADDRPAAVADLAVRFGADVVHAHLIRGELAGQLARLGGVPLVVTVHNTRHGWPPGLELVGPDSVALLVACGRAVERDVAAAGIPVPVRTAWNGIDVGAYARAAAAPGRRAGAERRSAGEETGGPGGWPALVLACVANPRPQKRLHLLPAVLRAVRDELARRGDARDARLVLAGEAGGESAAACLDEVWRAAADAGVAGHVEWTAGRRSVADVLADADLFVSVSAHEGLSLAQLEALAAGLPVVATDVGGAAEVAWRNRAVTLVPADAPPAAFAAAVLAAVGPVKVDPDEPEASATDPRRPRSVADASGSCGRESHGRVGVAAVRRDFSRDRMAARYAWLYRAALGPARGDVLWFVANNLSVGGAQSSLRRLVKALHADGVPVRVAVLQEHADHPTSGRLDLLHAGVPVVVLPPANTVEAEEAVGVLLGELSAAPPRSVTFWNVIQSYKVLLADALLRVPVYDVSPGEMYYDSLDKYLAKPRPGLPYRSARDYGERLAGVVVKYAAEAPTAADRLGRPVHVVPNGVPFPPQADRRAMAAERAIRAAAGRLVIGTAARLHPHKRIEDLVDAFRLALPRLPAGTVFRVVGGPDAGCEDHVAALHARAAGLPVEWVGEVVDEAGDTTAGVGAAARGTSAGILDGFDVFAMVSEPAGCPNASLEAMAAGLPVVATDVGGVSEQVADGVNGRLVPPRDLAALAEALVDVGRSAERRRAMGEASERRIAERFGLAGMVRAYRTVLGGG